MLAKLPSVEEFGANELKHALEIVSDNVLNYVVKNLILDSTNVSVEKMEDRDYRATINDFLFKLTLTRLERFARLNSSILNLETRAISAVNEIFQKVGSTISFRVFADLESAVAWLKAPAQ